MENRYAEGKFGRSLFGPHLDKIIFLTNNMPARDFASQGQKRLFVIISKFAQSVIIKNKIDSSPILIFDDVLSDLDRDNFLKIINLIEGRHQIFIATPNKEKYSCLKDLKEINLSEHLA